MCNMSKQNHGKQTSRKFLDELIPNREEYFNSQQLVSECVKQHTPISRKTIHNYIHDKLLPMPLHVGQEALFHKQFILDEIKSIHVLKSVFHAEYNDLRILAQNKFVNFQEIATYIYEILQDLKENNVGKGKGRPMLVLVSNEEFLQKVADLFLEEMKNGKDPRRMDISEFVREAFGKLKD